MPNQQTLVIIMEGGDEPNHEQLVSAWMRRHRDKITIETIEKLLALPNESVTVLVCTNRMPIIKYCEEHKVPYHCTRTNGTDFDYLQTLQTVSETSICEKSVCETTDGRFLTGHSIRGHSIGSESSFYHSAIVFGGTALPLAEVEQLEYLIEAMRASSSGTVWANNPISPDVVGWSPVHAIAAVQRVQNDNELAAALRDQAGLQMELWDRELNLTFDIDTPIDILVSSLTNKALHATVHATDDPVCANTFQTLTGLREAVHGASLPSLTLIGRVSPHTVTFLNQEIKARVRVFSEERGMKGLRRDQGGLVWSLAADWFERFESYEQAFETLAAESDGIIIDTRVWMAHHTLHLTEEDRFASDLLLVDRIKNEKLRRFTEAAASCSVPVLLGGFGLVNQGIQLLLRK